MRSDLLSTCNEIKNSIQYNMEQLLNSGVIKASIATLATVYSEIFFGDIIVLNIYFIFIFGNLITGIWKAKIQNRFDRRRIKFWVRKVLMHFIIIGIIGGICHSLFRLTGYTAIAVSWLLFLFSVTEAKSIIDNLNTIGFPVPPIFYKLIAIIKKYTIKKLTSQFEDKEVKEEITTVIDETLGDTNGKQ